MTIGVVWEFFEFGMDSLFNLDMQKDTVIHTIRSVTLDPSGHNIPYVIKGIGETAVNGQELGIGGYLDIGLIDTMQDLIVNFAGAFVFSIIGFFYVKNRGKGSVAGSFIPRRKSKDRDFLNIAREISSCQGEDLAPDRRDAEADRLEDGLSVAVEDWTEGAPEQKEKK